jgi:sigma-B regulation protein RsbU (phosphoserine phosphatase)
MAESCTALVETASYQPVESMRAERGVGLLPNPPAVDTSNISERVEPITGKDVRMEIATQESPRVLIADDQHSVVEALRLLLKTAGYQTESVPSPQAVLDALENDSFDALMLDLNYTRDTTSGAEGLELLSRIQAVDRNLPVVVMTAWGNMELAIRAMQLGASDFILKPWENARVLATLKTQIGRHATERSQRQQLDQEFRDARRVQERLMMEEIPQFAHLDVAVAWQPARAVGGDYCDVLKFSETLAGFCIADVAGKGLPAALLMANVQAAVRALASPTLQPRDLCAHLNQILCQNTSADKFVTLFYGVIDTKAKKLVYCNAGHIAPRLLRPDGSLLRLEAGGPVLGEFVHWLATQGEEDFPNGARLLCVTDGILEAADASGDEFGDARLDDLLATSASFSAEALRDRMLRTADEHCGGQFDDDATVLALGLTN